MKVINEIRKYLSEEFDNLPHKSDCRFDVGRLVYQKLIHHLFNRTDFRPIRIKEGRIDTLYGIKVRENRILPDNCIALVYVQRDYKEHAIKWFFTEDKS